MTPMLPIVFFGSGPVAATSLRRLVRHFSVEAVVTKPRPEGHHGPVPVLDLASELDLPIVTAANKAELSTAIGAQTFASRVAVLIDFGIIVAEDVINKFPLGIVNSHFSLLPQWRGADPISFAILSGQAETGVSLMLLVPAMDEGPLLAQATVPVGRQDIEQLTAALIEASDELLATKLPLYVSGELKPQPQTGEPSYSRKLTKQDGELDFSKPAVQLEREIRAFLTWPKSHCKIAGIDSLLIRANVIEGSGKAGEIYLQAKTLGFYTSKDILVIEELKPAGSRVMTAEAFLAGYGSALK